MDNELTAVTAMAADEVSLVNRGANQKKRFPIFKTEELMDIEIMKAVLETEVDEEAQLAEMLEKAGLSDKGKSAAQAAVRLLSSFKNELPPGIVDKLSALVGVKKEPEGDDEEKPMFPDMKDKDAVKKWLEAMPEDLKKEFEPAADDDVQSEEGDEPMSEDMRKQLEARDIQLAELKKQNEEFQKSLKTERDARELSVWVGKAQAELSHYPGKSADELGQMLKSLHDLNPEVAAEQFAQMKVASEALKSSNLLKSAGNSGGGKSGGSAWDKIENMADGIIQKSSVILNRPQAIAKVLEMNPDLYNEYLNENPKQTGN